MIERAGTAVCLSVAIVIVAAIVLHQPVATNAAAHAGRLNSPPGLSRVEPLKPADGDLDSPDPPRAKSSHLPDSELTRVLEGEAFRDVARRVYGDTVELEAFWRINRDQLATMDAEVRAGMILRTPPL